MMKIKNWVIAIVLAAACFHWLQGCGIRKENRPAAAETPANAQELPVLEQNLVYLTNRETKVPEPDYSFKEVPSGNEGVPEDAVPVPNLD